MERLNTKNNLETITLNRSSRYTKYKDDWVSIPFLNIFDVDPGIYPKRELAIGYKP